MNNRFFSEYRAHDYRTPRSMREAYGYDARLYEDLPEMSYSPIYWVIAFVWVICWVGAGWI